MRFKFAKMLAIAAGVAVTQSAFAADMPVKAPVAVVAATWTGIYVGGHGGYGWGHNDWTDSTPTIPDSIRVRNNVDGWVGGGHIGIQRQWGNLVAGVEGSFSAASIKSDRDPQLFVGFIRTFESKINDIVTAVGRLGYAQGPWLLYAKGGYASAKVRTTSRDLTGGVGPGVILADSSQRQHGWTVGAGVEHMFLGGWIIGVEYNYFDLGSKDNPNTNAPGIVTHNFLGTEPRFSTVLARLSYKFNPFP